MGYHVQFLDKKGLAIRNGGVFSQLVYTRAESRVSSLKSQVAQETPGLATTDSGLVTTTPLIPYGKADLILGVDILEAVRGLDPAHPYRVASPHRTAAVVNTAKTPTILSLLGTQDFKVSDLEDTLRKYTRSDRYLGFNVGDLCERVLDTKLYANIMMVGMAFQRGLLPLTQEVLEAAIKRVCRGEADRNLRAFNIGRKIAVRPELFVVEQQHEYESARKTLRRKVNTIRVWYGNRRGETLARQFRVLMKSTFRATRGLRVDDTLLRDVIIRAYDCMIWGGIDYARRYTDRLVATFHKDHPSHGYEITRAVVHNLAKVMLIKDEIYVASMLTSPEKYRRDRRRFNVNPDRGDRIVYKHHNRPEFEIFGRNIRFEWKSRDWQLRLMSKMGFARKLLPQWHIRERQFRDWYEGLVDRLPDALHHDEREYQRHLAVLRTPAPVTGFREIRYPKMEAARAEAARLLALDAEAFDPAAAVVPAATPAGRSVPLPVLSR